MAIAPASIGPERYVAQSAEFRPDRYYRYAELTELLRNWESAHSSVVSVESIGQSYEGRDIWVVILTNKETGPHDEKPAYFVDANIHAGEVTGSAVALFTIHQFLSGYNTDDRITRLLDQTTLYVVPRIGVDGAEVYLSSPDQMRSSMRPWPEPETKEGVQREDLDGPWKVSAKDDRLLVKRGPDETGGEYYFVYPEGTIKNFDGGAVTVAPSLWGLDNNRNFPVQWGPDWKQNGAGAYPLSEPETRALADFLIAHPNIHGSQHYPTFSGVILRPSSLRTDDDLPKSDVRIFKALGELGTEETGYRCVSIFQDFAYDKKIPIMGSLTDWTYEQLGLYSFATELWSLPFQAGLEVKDFIKWFEERTEDDDLAMLKVLDQQLDGAGFKRWTPFQHPQLGEVEIGGWEFKFTYQNPPGPLLEEECRKNAGFTIRAMGAAPRIEILEAEAESLGADLYRVHVLVENTGFLPTNGSEAYKATSRCKPVEVTLELGDGMERIMGKEKEDLGHLDGRASQFEAFSVFPAYDNDARKRVEWLVRAPKGGEITVIAGTARAGTVRASITLSST